MRATFIANVFLLVLHKHFSPFLWHIWKKNNYNFTEKENNATWYIAHNIIVLLYCSKGRFNHYHCIYLVCGFNINLNLKVQRKKQIWLRFYTMKIYPGQTGYFNTVEIIQNIFYTAPKFLKSQACATDKLKLLRTISTRCYLKWHMFFPE